MSDVQVKGMLAGIEDVWRCFDELLDELKSRADWAQPHGADWTLADVPFHMMYTERDLVAGAIQRGEDVPPPEQKAQRTMRELNAWNTAKFAERPAHQTPEQSTAQWRQVRDDVRTAMASLQDEDLEGKRVWFPLVGCGWVPAMVSAGFALAHGWSEFVQLRYHLGRTAPEPEPTTTHGAIGFLVGFLPGFINQDEARKAKLTTVMSFSGPGGGAWTVRVEDGKCALTEESASDADLLISPSEPGTPTGDALVPQEPDFDPSIMPALASCRQYKGGRLSFTANLWREIAPIYDAILAHPFIAELTDGSLSPDRFVFYIQQDSLYLQDFARALGLAGVRSVATADVKAFLDFGSEALSVEHALHESYFAEFGASADADKAPVCFAYTSYLLATAAVASYPEAIAALLPCFWIYREAALAIHARAQETLAANPYKRWIEMYAGAEYDDAVEKAIAITERAAADATDEDRRRMVKAFVSSARLEWMFWDSAYRLEQWPPG